MNTPLSWIKADVPELSCTDQEYVDAMTEMDENFRLCFFVLAENCASRPDRNPCSFTRNVALKNVSVL